MESPISSEAALHEKIDFNSMAEKTNIPMLTLKPANGTVRVSGTYCRFDDISSDLSGHAYVVDAENRSLSHITLGDSGTEKEVSYDRVIDIGGIYTQVIPLLDTRKSYTSLIADEIFPKVSSQGFAIVYPLKNYPQDKLIEALENAADDAEDAIYSSDPKMLALCKNMKGFTYFIGTDTSGNDMLLIGNGLTIFPISSKNYTRLPGASKSFDPGFNKLEMPPADTVAYGSRSLHIDTLRFESIDDPDIIKISNSSIFNIKNYKFIGTETIDLGEETKIKSGNTILYISSLNLAKGATAQSFFKDVSELRSYLDSHPEIDFIITLTWLEKWMHLLGMTKSYLGIDRDDMKSEVDAINIQRTDVLNSTNATDVLKSFAAKMPKDFDPKKVAYYYCRNRDFGMKNPYP